MSRFGWIKPLTALVLILATGSPLSVSAGNMPVLYSYQVKKLVTDLATQKQEHYVIQFDKDDGFVFHIPVINCVNNTQQMAAEPTILHIYEEGGAWQPAPIPERLVVIRNALVAAKIHFDKLAVDSGIKLQFSKPGPVDVIISPVGVQIVVETKEGKINAAGYFSYTRHEIALNWDDMGPGSNAIFYTPVHEYFHAIHSASILNGANDPLVGHKNKFPYGKFLTEMSAVIAEDEAIDFMVSSMQGSPFYAKAAYESPHAKHGAILIDDLQTYQDPGYRWSRKYNQGLFSTERGFKSPQYPAAILLKYWAEQVRQGRDESALSNFLKAMRRGHADRTAIEGEEFFRVLSEQLPAHRWKGNWRERWVRFYSAFAATSFYMHPDRYSGSKRFLGIQDLKPQQMHNVVLAQKQLREDVYHRPQTLYREPAINEKERIHRMSELLGEGVGIEALAYNLNKITFGNRTDGAGRTVYSKRVFLIAEGGRNTESFLLQQPHAAQRKSALSNATAAAAPQTKLVREFSLLDNGHDDQVIHAVDVQVGDEFDVVSGDGRTEALWVGLVNADPSEKPHKMRFGYIGSPHLLKAYRYKHGRSVKVKLDQGRAAKNYSGDDTIYIREGDDFEVLFRTTGPLHVISADKGKANSKETGKKELSPDDVTITVTAHTSDGTNLKLEEPRFRVEEVWEEGVTEYYEYRFIARLPKLANHVQKEDAFLRLKLTSLLNLGDGDEEIDESFKFRIPASVPRVVRMQIWENSESEDNLLYDSRNAGLIRMPDVEQAQHDLMVRMEFSLPMKENTILATAGLSPPYNSFPIQDLDCNWRDVICSGMLHVPASSVSDNGGLLRFSVGGQADSGSSIDSDLIAVGDQPDQAHFLLLGMDEFYELQVQASQNMSNADGESARFGPIAYKVLLTPTTTHVKAGLVEKAGYGSEQISKVLELANAATEEIRQAIQNADGEREQELNEKLELVEQNSRFIKKELLPRYDAVLRLTTGFKEFGYDSEVGGAVSASFGGYEGEYFAEAFQTGAYSVRSPKWVVRDIRNLEYPDYYHASDTWHAEWERGGAPHLKLFDYVQSDMESFRELLGKLEEFPRQLNSPHPDMGADAHLEKYAGFYYELYHFQIGGLAAPLNGLIDAMWQFFPSEEQSDSYSQIGNRALPPVPKLKGKRMIRLSKPFSAHYPLSWPSTKVSGLGAPKGSVVRPLNPPPDYGTRTIEGCDKCPFNWIGPVFSGFIENQNHILYLENPRQLKWHYDGVEFKFNNNLTPNMRPNEMLLYPDSDEAHALIRVIASSTGPANQPSATGTGKAETVVSLTRNGVSTTGHSTVPVAELIESEEAVPDEKAGLQDDANKDRALISSTEHKTGITTTSKRNPNGSRTITVTDKDGNVLSEKIIPAGKGSSWGKSVDKDTGITTLSEGQADGSALVTQTDADGNLISQYRRPSAAQDLPSASSYDPSTGVTTTSQRNADGSVTIEKVSSSGEKLFSKTIGVVAN